MSATGQSRPVTRPHCRSDADSLVNPSGIIVHVMQGDGLSVIVDSLAESMGQPRASDHGRPHREILLPARI